VLGTQGGPAIARSSCQRYANLSEVQRPGSTHCDDLGYQVAFNDRPLFVRHPSDVGSVSLHRAILSEFADWIGRRVPCYIIGAARWRTTEQAQEISPTEGAQIRESHQLRFQVGARVVPENRTFHKLPLSCTVSSVCCATMACRGPRAFAACWHVFGASSTDEIISDLFKRLVWVDFAGSA